ARPRWPSRAWSARSWPRPTATCRIRVMRYRSSWRCGPRLRLSTRRCGSRPASRAPSNGCPRPACLVMDHRKASRSIVATSLSGSARNLTRPEVPGRSAPGTSGPATVTGYTVWWRAVRFASREIPLRYHARLVTVPKRVARVSVRGLRPCGAPADTRQSRTAGVGTESRQPSHEATATGPLFRGVSTTVETDGVDATLMILSTESRAGTPARRSIYQSFTIPDRKSATVGERPSLLRLRGDVPITETAKGLTVERCGP